MQYIGQDELALAVSVEAFSDNINLAEDDPTVEASLEAILFAAQSVVTDAMRRPPVSMDVEFTVSLAAFRRWWFPVAPVQELQSVAVLDSEGVWQELDTAQIRLVRANDEPQLLFPADWQSTHCDALEMRVRAVVGYREGAPEGKPICQTITLLAKEWFNAGIPIEGTEMPRQSMGVTRLIKQRRYKRPQVCAAE